MERSDPQILIKIVGRRLREKKRNQSIPPEVLALAKNLDPLEYIMREVVENDDDIIHEDVDIGLD